MFGVMCVGPSGAPLNFLLQAVDAFTLSMMWDPPSVEHRNGVILHYIVNITDTPHFLSVDTSSIITLHPDYTYVCSIAAETSEGHGPYQTEIIRMPEAGMCIK